MYVEEHTGLEVIETQKTLLVTTELRHDIDGIFVFVTSDENPRIIGTGGSLRDALISYADNLKEEGILQKWNDINSDI